MNKSSKENNTHKKYKAKDAHWKSTRNGKTKKESEKILGKNKNIENLDMLT